MKKSYDGERDVCLLSGEVPDEIGSRIMVGLYSYDGGPVKVGVVRATLAKDGSFVFSRIGRLEIATWIRVQVAVEKLIEEFKHSGGRMYG